MKKFNPSSLKQGSLGLSIFLKEGPLTSEAESLLLTILRLSSNSGTGARSCHETAHPQEGFTFRETNLYTIPKGARWRLAANLN
jgi:hypothetical protein